MNKIKNENLIGSCEDNSPPLEGLGDVETPTNEKRPGYITANPFNYVFIKEMRDVLKANPTKAEKVMWEYLRNKKTGHKIRRQHIINNFITDFVCLHLKTVIEIDGKIHLKKKEYDDLRTFRLNELGYEIIRFTNEEVFNNPEFVVFKIKEFLDNKSNVQFAKEKSISEDEDLSMILMNFKTPPNLPEGEASQNKFLSKDTCINNGTLEGICDGYSPPLEGLGEVETQAEK